MYYAIIFLVCFELFLSYYLNKIIKLLSNYQLVSEYKDEKTNSEIVQLEEELKELNKPSTFTEYVKKNRQLNLLKRTLNSGATQTINHTCNKNIKKKILRGIYLILKIIDFLPSKIRQFLAFYIVKRYFNKYNLIITFNQKLYSPFFQTKEKFNNINSLLSYGVVFTITDLIKNLIKYL